ncbi:MAG: hypothetical protein ACPL7K_00160, partial [Armatimonadota bacterium]
GQHAPDDREGRILNQVQDDGVRDVCAWEAELIPSVEKESVSHVGCVIIRRTGHERGSRKPGSESGNKGLCSRFFGARMGFARFLLQKAELGLTELRVGGRGRGKGWVHSGVGGAPA